MNYYYTVVVVVSLYNNYYVSLLRGISLSNIDLLIGTCAFVAIENYIFVAFNLCSTYNTRKTNASLTV